MKVNTLSNTAWGLCLIAISFAAAGCATNDAKRDDETYKRDAKAEKHPPKTSRPEYPNPAPNFAPPEPTPDVPIEQLPIEPLEKNT